MPIAIETATADTFDATITSTPDRLVVVYFWGPECPNCEVFARDLPGLLAEVPPAVRLVKVNAYEFPEVARRFALFGIPGFVLFKGGRKLGMMRQYNGREFWRTVIAEQSAA